MSNVFTSRDVEIGIVRIKIFYSTMRTSAKVRHDSELRYDFFIKNDTMNVVRGTSSIMNEN